MKEVKSNEVFVSIDLGSHSFKLAIASFNSESGFLELKSLEEIPSDGIKKGAITNINKVGDRLNVLITKTIEKTGYAIKNVCVCYSSEYMEGINSSGVAGVGERGRGKAISEDDKTNVLNAVQAIVIAEDKEIAHILPSRYVVDNQEQVKDPLGMVAVRLEAEAHLIIVNEMLLNNIHKTFNIIGLNILDMIYSPLSASEMVLTKNERVRGVIYLDIGLNLTKLLFFKNDNLYFSDVLAIGGASLTSDIAYMLKIDTAIAEDLKINNGCAYLPLLDKDNYAFIKGNNEEGPTTISERYMCEIIMARASDILNNCKNLLEKKGWLKEANYVVIGGGTGNLTGIGELASKIFELPAHSAVCGTGFEDLSDKQREGQFGSVLGILKNISNFNKKVLEKSLNVRHNSSMKNEINFAGFFRNIFKDIF